MTKNRFPSGVYYINIYHKTDSLNFFLKTRLTGFMSSKRKFPYRVMIPFESNSKYKVILFFEFEGNFAIASPK